jgi:hypothetical protein
MQVMAMMPAGPDGLGRSSLSIFRRVAGATQIVEILGVGCPLSKGCYLHRFPIALMQIGSGKRAGFSA